MKKPILLVATLVLIAGCAPFASNISPSPISAARYDGWNCNKLRAEQKFVEDSLVRVSADQDSAATTDIWMVILIGVPTSGGGVKGEVARLKGEGIALHNAMVMAGCITGEETKPEVKSEVKAAPIEERILGVVAQSTATPITSAHASTGTPTEGAAAPTADTELREQILDMTLLRKQYAKQDDQDYVLLDIALNAKGLDKPARAIKGVLSFTDLFGEQKFALKWTIEKPIAPGATHTDKGSGFKYNQFVDSHQWVRHTEKENMKVKFRVDNILYQDGTTRAFD